MISQNVFLTLRWPFLRDVSLILLGSFIITVATNIIIPLYPVPVTMQDFAVLFLSMTCGKRLGTLSVLAYLCEGALGLPVFSRHQSIAALLSPTGGYLMAFLPAAFISGTLFEKCQTNSFMKTFFFNALLSGFIGLIVIYIGGLAQLSQFVGFQRSITFGLQPFLFVDFLKLLLLSSIVSFWKATYNR